MKIAVYGEGLVDLVPSPHETGRSLETGSAVTAEPSASTVLMPLAPALGGGPFNVALAAARLGADVEFHSRLSTDSFGQALVGALQAEGVDTSPIQRGPEPTTLALTHIRPDGSAEYSFYIEGTADRLAEPAVSESDIACFGTCSLALEPAASRYVDVLKQHSDRGTLVALDPNIRPFFATEEHRARLIDALDHVHLLKLSDEEVEFFGKDVLSRVPVVVTTCGGEGIHVRAGGDGMVGAAGSVGAAGAASATSGVSVTVDSVAVEVADTIGAGDTVMAALLTQLAHRGVCTREALLGLRAEEWEELLSFAATAAGITVSRQGCNPPTLDEVRGVHQLSQA